MLHGWWWLFRQVQRLKQRYHGRSKHWIVIFIHWCGWIWHCRWCWWGWVRWWRCGWRYIIFESHIDTILNHIHILSNLSRFYLKRNEQNWHHKNALVYFAQNAHFAGNSLKFWLHPRQFILNRKKNWFDRTREYQPLTCIEEIMSAVAYLHCDASL